MSKRRKSYPIKPIPKRLELMAFLAPQPALPPPHAICGVCGYTARKWPSNFCPECSTEYAL